MESILEVIFDIISVPLQKWDKLKSEYKVVISTLLLLIVVIGVYVSINWGDLFYKKLGYLAIGKSWLII